MKRPHRVFHRRLWPVLAVAVALGLGLALAWRPPSPLETSTTSGQ